MSATPFPTYVVQNKNPERIIVALSQVIELLVSGKKSAAEGGIRIDIDQDGGILISSDLRLSNVEFPSETVDEGVGHYALRNPIDLDRAGNYYVRHVCAMTREGLHLKSKIAAELGYRDMEIDRLKAELAKLQALPSVDAWNKGYLAGYNRRDAEVKGALL